MVRSCGYQANLRSNPFNINDLGKVYVKLDKVESASDLVTVKIVISEATLRLQITQVKEQRFWPYQIRNLTDKTINFYQKVQTSIILLTVRMLHAGNEKRDATPGPPRATIPTVSRLEVECVMHGTIRLPTTRRLC